MVALRKSGVCSASPPCLLPSARQAQRKAESLHQALAALSDKVKQHAAPNKDVQKEIADMTEVRRLPPPLPGGWRAEASACPSPVHRHRPHLPVEEG